MMFRFTYFRCLQFIHSFIVFIFSLRIDTLIALCSRGTSRGCKSKSCEGTFEPRKKECKSTER